MDCLINDLKILKESSKEAVETLENFSDFKKYLHVKRQIEEDLLTTIKKSYNLNGKKLILVCGGVGDGKSHLISHLKSYYDDIMNKFVYHNDATESDDPHSTSIETLNKKLKSFSDENLEKHEEIKMIIAINLGTLNNFLNSKYGDNFLRLKNYVEVNKILKTSISILDERSEYFEYVNFSDYHLYQLTKEGAKSDFLEKIIDKLVSENIKNKFNNSYKKNCLNCEIMDECPVKYNYEFLKNVINQKYLINLLIEIMVKYKLIISARNLLNFFYDILVDSSLDSNYDLFKLKKYIRKKTHKELLNSLIENLIFENNKSNKILDNLKNIDPLRLRNKERDLEIINFSLNLKTVFSNDSVHPLINGIVKNLILTDDNRREIIKYSIRYNYLKNPLSNEIYNNYLKSLYDLNTGLNRNNIIKTYKEVTESIYLWNDGDYKNQLFGIFPGRKQLKYKIQEKLELRPDLKNINTQDKDVLDKFYSNLMLHFLSGDNSFKIEIDYFLYELLYKLKEGYKISVGDRNIFINFDNLLKDLAKYGEGSKKLIITDRLTNQKFQIEEDHFEDGWCINICD